MQGSRRTTRVLVAVALLAALLGLSGGHAQAGTIDVECEGADQASQDLLTALGDGTIDAGVSGRVVPASLAEGSNDLEFYVGLVLPASLIETAAGAGITSADLKNVTATLSPGPGLTGPDLVGNPPAMSVSFASGVPDVEFGPFAETYNVTAGIGETVSWNLTSAALTIGISLNGTPLDINITCAQSGSGAIISAPVLPPFVSGGPTVPALTATTPEDTPVDVDLLAGVGEGDAPTDPDSLSILSPASDGSTTLSGGVVTYTPRSGFVGTDTFAYEVCTEEFSIDGANQITEITGITDGQEFSLIIDGTETEVLTAPATAADLQAAIDAAVGEGNAVVTEIEGGFAIEWTGALAETAVAVSVDSTGDADPEVTEAQAAQEGEPGRLCNSNVVTVNVTPVDGPTSSTTSTTTAPGGGGGPARPQGVPAGFTG